MGNGPSKLTPAGRAAILKNYARWKNRAAAAAAADVHIGTLDVLLREDPAFRKDFEQAGEQYIARLEKEVERRAHDGIPRQKALGSGDSMVIVTEQHYSDVLMLRLLERHEKRWRKGEVLEHSGQVAAAVDLSALSPDARRKLRDLLEQVDQDTTEPVSE